MCTQGRLGIPCFPLKEFLQLFENSNFKKVEQLMEDFYLTNPKEVMLLFLKHRLIIELTILKD